MADKAEPETPTGPTDSERAARVFISYASQDKPVADAVCQALEQAGVACWIAPRNVVPGESYAGAIVHAIDDTKVIVLILSKHGASSQHVLREVERASSKRHPVVAFRIDSAPMPADFEYFLNTSQWLDASGGTIEHALPELVTAIHRLLGPPAIRSPVADRRGESGANANGGVAAISGRASKPRPKRYWAIAAITAGILLVVAAGKFWLSNRSTPQNATAPVAAVTFATAPRAAAISEKSIAVLPFADMSEKHDQEYFSEGLAEELMDHLAKSPGLHVVARTSSFYFKDKQIPLNEIARALHVANILQGSVRKSGNRLRVTTQLVLADTGNPIWSETYDSDLKDIFKIQDDIAASVVKALKATLEGQSRQNDRTDNLEAYKLLLQGRFLLSQGLGPNLQTAAKLLSRSVELDPKYAAAWVDLATAYYEMSSFVNMDPAANATLARNAITHAMIIDPENALGRYLSAIMRIQYDHDPLAAVRDIEAAYRADPNEPRPEELVLVTGCVAGPCYEQYIHDLTRNIGRDPFNTGALDMRGWALFCAGNLKGAETDYRNLLAINPGYEAARYALAAILIAQKRPAEALTVAAVEPLATDRRAALAISYVALKRGADAEAQLREMLANDAKDGPREIAEVYAALGNTQAALDWVQKDYDDLHVGIFYLRTDPLLRPVSGDPRFKALMKRIWPIG